MPTIRDVAKRAGVAPTTVSRVIHNSGYVSAETRSRVEAAIEELGYVPNRLARSLRLKRTHTLALVVTDITNPFWTTVVRGVEDAAHGDGFNVVLCNTDESLAAFDDLPSELVVDPFLTVVDQPACPNGTIGDRAADLPPVRIGPRRVSGGRVAHRGHCAPIERAAIGQAECLSDRLASLACAERR